MREYPTDEELSAFVARLEQEELYAPAHLKEEILLKTEQTKKSQTAPVSFFVYTLKMVAGMAAAIILTFVIPANDGSEFSKAKDLENYPSEVQNDISLDEKISRYMEERRKEKYEETDSLFEKMNELFSRNSGGMMMKTKKKNKFFTFCFSLFPGAGEMYMGFMKAGVSLMLLFFLALLIPTVLRLDIFSSLAVIVWFYGFFHTNHLAVLNDEEFNQVEDNYLFGMDMLVDGRNFVTKYQKWVAIALIGAGVLLLWNTMTDIAYRLLPEIIYGIMRTIGNYVPRTLVAVVIILIGVRMIKGRKEQLAKLEEEKKGE